METTRVDINYRPLRIAWAIHSNDREALREVVRLTHTFWGGCFNPIIFADRVKESEHIVDLFRADMVIPVGASEEVKGCPLRFPHLINPLFPETLFFNGVNGTPRARVLDIHNALIHRHDTPEWKSVDQTGFRRFVWDEADPLSDTFLLQRGAFPNPEVIGIDYLNLVSDGTLSIDCKIEKSEPIPMDWLEHPSIGFLARLGLNRHYSIRVGWDYAGFFVGDASNIDDLACFWNLRAADIQVQFFDPNYVDRYALIQPEYGKRKLASVAQLDEHRRGLAIWSRTELDQGTIALLGDGPKIVCRASGPSFWSGGAIRPPMMTFGEASTLGVFSQETDKPKLSFALPDKPFAVDKWFHTQHLVASVALYSDHSDYTFQPPYVPEWNEFFARRMHFHFDQLRIEPERIGIVIDATEHDTYIYGLSISALVEKLFESIGLRSTLSDGGLIAHQLISRLGGVGGTRVFKIPGVRRLLKTHGPRDSFSKEAALGLIGGKDPDNPSVSFADHRRLFIEPREFNTDLSASMVFTHMVEKGLLRIGARLVCPGCNIPSWTALDALKTVITCELCGRDFNTSKQLVSDGLQYRRNGVLGLERDSQGAVPVALVLQQLKTNLFGIGNKAIFCPSYDLTPVAGTNLPKCEVDFVIIFPENFPGKAQVIIGECKDRGGNIDEKDVSNLRRIADAIRSNRFEAYIAFAKLSPFTPEELALVDSLNHPHQRRVILLTSRELEPYDLYERTDGDSDKKLYGGSPAELVRVTDMIYFST